MNIEALTFTFINGVIPISRDDYVDYMRYLANALT
jgi:hypothetical protein